MRSSLVLGAALLLTIVTRSIGSPVKSEHTCGNLGPGINACRCGEIVVKAAKVQKPLFYASPEAINEAAAAREAVGRLSVGTDRWQSESVASFPNKPYAYGGTYSGSSSSSSSSSSSVGILGGSNAYSPFKSVSSRVTSNCGCGKTSESLEVRDLLSSNIEGKVVPSFPPIGDLCYPSSPSSDKFQVITKVTPAHPGKIKCEPPIPYEVCVQVLNGQIDEAGLRKLGLTAGGSAISGSLGKYAATRYGSSGRFGGYGGSYAGSSASSTAYGQGSYAGASAAGFATSSNIKTIQGSATSRRTSSYESPNDFGDDLEFPEDYSYPRLPADPVSVTLAYKNLFPRTVYYNKRAFIPEDKLAFGHRTVPTEPSPSKKVPDVPEEKLQVLDKPVVELKSVSSVPVTIGAYDEHEEAKLAELEAIERERINQEEIAQRQQENFITYGDLGYAPCNEPLSTDPIGTFNAQDDIAADCGPIGPPDPDYVPGSVVVNRELVKNEDQDDTLRSSVHAPELYVRHYADDNSYEEDDSDDSTSGIFARLKSFAQKHGPSYQAV